MNKPFQSKLIKSLAFITGLLVFTLNGFSMSGAEEKAPEIKIAPTIEFPTPEQSQIEQRKLIDQEESSDNKTTVRIQTAQPQNSLPFPKNREAYREAQSWRTEEPDPVMIEVKNSSIDQFRQNNVDRYISEVVNIINANSTNDFHKVKMINDILCLTLKYDVKSYFSGDLPSQDYRIVLSKGLAVCEGFANSFLKFCNVCGIKCRIAHGYARGASTSLQTEAQVSKKTNHAWNIVTINGKDYLVDSCWNQGYLNGTENVIEYTTQWLFTYPESFIYMHFPEYERDQLLEKPISRQTFYSLPALRAFFFDLVESWNNELKSNVICDGYLEYDFTLVQENYDPHFSITIRDTETSAPLEDTCYFFKMGLSSDAKLMLSFPKEGTYRISLFGKSNFLGEFYVRSTKGSSIKFPTTYSNYGLEKDGVLDSPIVDPLKKGDEVFFSVRTKGSEAYILIDDSKKGNVNWNRLTEKDNGVFEGSILIPDSAGETASLCIKTDKYYTIARFEIE